MNIIHEERSSEIKHESIGCVSLVNRKVLKRIQIENVDDSIRRQWHIDRQQQLDMKLKSRTLQQNLTNSISLICWLEREDNANPNRSRYIIEQ